jgi:hypothetical protein
MAEDNKQVPRLDQAIKDGRITNYWVRDDGKIEIKDLQNNWHVEGERA